MIERTEAETAALEDLQRAMLRGQTLAAEGLSSGARRRELRQRLESLAGRPADHADPKAWLAAREEALNRLRRDLGREIEELSGQQEQLQRGFRRWFPPAEARALQGRRIRRILDLLEILGRLQEIREIRQVFAAGPRDPHGA